MKLINHQPFSSKKKLFRIVSVCCITILLLQAMIMAALLFHQHTGQEKADTLYLLENTHRKLSSGFQYLEDVALILQDQPELQNFFHGNCEDPETAEACLKSSASLFSERNHISGQAPFIEKIYLFNSDGDCLSSLYYPATLTRMEEAQKNYHELNNRFLTMGERFYFALEEDSLNLCLRLYDSHMTPLGTCILALNKSGITENYELIENHKYYSWSIYQDTQLLLGHERLPEHGHREALEHTLRAGFDLTLTAQIPVSVIYSTTVSTLFLIVLITAALLALLVFVVHLIRDVYETRLTAQQAELQYLQSQINPHFLSNALTMIQMRAALNGDKEVQEMLHHLSRLYLGKIFRKDELFISLQEEIQLIDFYLSLQTNRFKEKLTYTISYTGNTEDYKHLAVPRLSIEPVVENAVCHGLIPKAGAGTIEICISKSGNALEITIKDDGVGFSPDSITTNKHDPDHTHVGLWNTDKMIRNLCGNEFGLNIESTPGCGTTVYIRLPIKTEDTYVESNDC